jgi:RNA 2',3'-cyclic 3'-phosphodiesterase
VTVRVFSALPLPRIAIAGIDSSFSAMRQLYPRLRWVGAQGFHFTLHFFGEITEDSVEALRRVLDDPALRRPPIPARLGPVGQFPPRGSPRVIWVGVEKGAQEMSSYWRLFEEKIAPLGFPPDARGFTPHVTVARAGGLTLDNGWGAGIEAPVVDFLLEECVLFQSVLGKGGAEYIPLKRISFEKEER